MEIVKIPFSGITRNTDDGICQDGECMELINARIHDGSIEAVSNPIKRTSFFNEYDKIFYHPMVEKYICITNDNHSLISFDKEFKLSEALSPDVIGVYKVEFIGRTICALTNTGIKYFLFKNDAYTYIGDKPKYTFSVVADDEKDIEITDKIYDCQFTDAVSGNLKIDYRDIDPFIDFMDSCKNEALAPYKDKARFADPICVRAALKFYDGSYMAHSPVHLVFPSKAITGIGGISLSGTYTSKGSNTKYGAIHIKNWMLHTFLVKYAFSFDDISSWQDLILSVDIFISRPFSLIDIESSKENGIFINNIPELIQMETYKKDGMLEKIMSLSSQMYLSVSEYGNYKEGHIQEAEVSNDMLPDDNYSHNRLCAAASYVYNGRLHLGNIKNILFGGFLGEFSFKGGEFNGNTVSQTGAVLKTFTYITTDYGEKIVFNTGGVIHPLSPIFCYPDYRATKVVIYAAIADSGQVIYKKRTLDLKRATGMNMAFYIGWNEGKISYGVSNIDILEGATITADEFDNPLISIDNIEYSPNKIKVSELNNPFSFPAKQTYTPSNDEIIALHSNTSALSQGQFGQYPLYIFCKDGIYSMQVGTGEIVYTASAPVSRDVCISPSVCAIDSAIAFPTERGIMIISGTNVQCISTQLDGYLSSSVLSSPILPKILTIGRLEECLSSVTFKDYITDSQIGYNYQQSEIIIANPSFPYSYVYNMKSRTWHKISLQISNFVNVYPETYVIVQKELYDLNNNHRSIATMALLTRPIKMGTNTHKRILQTALRGIVKRALSDLYLRGEPVMFRGESLDIFSDVGFYILGSNDAEHFSLIAGKESIVDIRDLVTKMNKSKAYKYFMVALIGGVRSDVSLNYIEVIADQSYGNRLR